MVVDGAVRSLTFERSLVSVVRGAVRTGVFGIFRGLGVG